MELRWVIDFIEHEPGKAPEYIVGIENCENGKIDPICRCEYSFDAEIIRDALDAHVVPGDYYR
ncbi:MAG: hypothetical protein ABFD18_07545 [Syntrophomonas sp.]